MRVGIATDHGGFELKELKSYLRGSGHVVVDAGLAQDHYPARQGVEHDDMNIPCMGGRVVGPLVAQDLVDAFLAASFTGEEWHRRRLEKVTALEARAFGSRQRFAGE